MIRGQTKNPSRQSHTSNNNNAYLNVPNHARTLSGNVDNDTSLPSPSSNDIPLSRTRHERAAKTQANAAFYQQHPSPSSRGISPTSDDDGSGSDEEDYDSPQDSEMTPADEGTIELPKIFNSNSSTAGAPSSTATPSFQGSPLQTGGAFGDHDHAFSCECSRLLRPCLVGASHNPVSSALPDTGRLRAGRLVQPGCILGAHLLIGVQQPWFVASGSILAFCVPRPFPPIP